MNKITNLKELQKFALEIRIETLKAIGKKGGGHIGGSLTIADLLAVLYGDVMRYCPSESSWGNRDFLVCSKGHAGPALYSALALKGFFPLNWLDRLNVGGTNLPGHCDRKVPGIDATTGSLGQGLSIAVGIALGLKIQDKDQYVYCITGDGEHAEGQIWEAVTCAAHFKLNNLIAFLDWNKKQIDGTNDAVMTLGNVKMKYESFGWTAIVVNGTSINAIKNAIDKAKQSKNEPSLIILDVIKGSGVPNIEALDNNHAIPVSPEMVEIGLAYLHKKYAEITTEN
jgi:transketolase